MFADLGILATADELPSSEPGRTDLAQIVRDELAAQATELRAAGVAIGTVDLTPVVVVADAGRIHQVVRKQLASCARHCWRGDHVDVTVGPRGTRSGPASLGRRSRHPGGRPAPGHRSVLARRGHARERTGLGPALVQEIVTAHRGSVQATYTASTRVTIRLPQVPT